MRTHTRRRRTRYVTVAVLIRFSDPSTAKKKDRQNGPAFYYGGTSSFSRKTRKEGAKQKPHPFAFAVLPRGVLTRRVAGHMQIWRGEGCNN